MSGVLITGGAGAIGGNLVGALVEAGEHVVVLDDLSSGVRANVPDGVRLVVGSVADAEAVAQAMADRPRVVLHLAARFANQNSVDHPVEDLFDNGLGTLRVLEEASRTGVERVIVCSSSCVYRDGSSTAEDDVVYSTDTPYAITKALSEGYARFFSKDRGLHTVIVRPFNVYGPGERPGRYRNVIPNFFRLALDGEPLPITGSGEETRDFTFVSDLVAGLRATVDADVTPGTAFNLGSGVETSVLELAERINAITGNEAGMIFQPRRSWDTTARRIGDITRARELLGYRPEVELGDGLQRTYDWLRQLDG